MTWPSYTAPHFCYYRRLQGSSRLDNNTMDWIERCRCGRLVKARMGALDGQPVVVKYWYDRDGKLERVTPKGAQGHKVEQRKSA